MARFEVIQTEPAYSEHAKQKIIMNEAGRLRLIQALQDKEVTLEVFCHDGEGYDLNLGYREDEIKPFYLMYALGKEEPHLASELAQAAAALAWCTPKTSSIQMIPELAEAFANIIDNIWEVLESMESKPRLGNATQELTSKKQPDIQDC